MRRPETPPRSLYLHVPFCSTRCDYCAFHSLAGRSSTAMAGVTRATVRDIERLSMYMPAIRTLYVGGGTPSALPVELLLELVRRPIELGARPVEVTVEANPESCTPQLLSALASAGVTRLSIGVQTLESAGARGLGRRLSTRGEIRSIRRTWPGVLSADLIHGAPESTPAGFRASIEAVLDIGVEHLSVYGLGVEPDTPLHRRVRAGQVGLADPEDWDDVVALVQEAGLRRYEVSNFARPGAESLHNETYWSAEHYLGLGPSAVSTLELRGRVVRVAQPTGHARFIAQQHPFDAEREVLTAEARRIEYAMLGLRRRSGISLARLVAGLPPDRTEALHASLAELCEHGLLTLTDNAIQPTDRGLNLLNRVIDRLIIDT